MKKNVAVASLLAASLALAPVGSAFAEGRHGGGYRGGGPIWGLANVLVGTAAAIITAPIAILAAAARAPIYYPPGTAYEGPPAGPAYYEGNAAPAYSGEPPAAPYYAPPGPPAYYAPPPVAYYAPPVAVPYYAPRPAYYSPGPAYYPAPRAHYYAPPPGGRYYSR